MKLIPYLLYLFLLTFFNTILGELISIKGVTMDITIFLVVLVALYKSEEEALWFGFFAGLIAGAPNPAVMPYEIIIVLIIAALSHLLANRINLDSLASRLIILGSAVFLHRIIVTLMVSSEEFLFVLVRFILPNAVYTMIIGMLYFMIKDGRITWQRVKALF